ncbi:hypothetical protein ACFX13_013802 [Malus domestica]
MPRLTLKFGVVEMQTMVKKYQQRFSKVRDEMDSWAVIQSLGPAPTTAGEEHKMTLQAGSTTKRSPSSVAPCRLSSFADVIALSLTTLLATNHFVCEICNNGFQRDQNLQLHRRGHNLPWKLQQRSGKEVKKRVYVCPETSCVHHDPSRALSDLTGIKKCFCKKHGEKKWKCDKCSKKYAVQSDWNAHPKICGTREYKLMENRSFDHMLGWMKKINPKINGVDGSEANPLNPTSYSILHLVGDLVGLLDHFGGQQAFVVGHGHGALGKEKGDNQKKAKANLCR